MKICSKCKIEKKNKEFYKCSSGSKDGLNSWCKDCFNRHTSKYRKGNLDRNRKWQKDYYYKNREKIIKKNVEYQRMKRKTDEDFREKENIKGHKRRARIKGNGGTFTLKEWNDLKKKCDYTCQMCFRKEPEIKLTKDHIIALDNGGENIITNIQPLCGSCNSKKGTK